MKLSNNPQQLRKPRANGEPQWWYYENPSSIDVMIDAKTLGPQKIRIPMRLIRKTIERQEKV